jgi:hypothetical protein
MQESRFWNSDYAGPGKIFAVGNVVTLVAADPLPDFLFPHATEDRIVDMGTPMKVLQTLDAEGMAAAVAAGVSGSLTLAFDGALVRAPSRKTGVTVATMLVCLLLFARKVAGARGARHSLPSDFRGGR